MQYCILLVLYYSIALASFFCLGIYWFQVIKIQCSKSEITTTTILITTAIIHITCYSWVVYCGFLAPLQYTTALFGGDPAARFPLSLGRTSTVHTGRQHSSSERLASVGTRSWEQGGWNKQWIPFFTTYFTGTPKDWFKLKLICENRTTEKNLDWHFLMPITQWLDKTSSIKIERLKRIGYSLLHEK